MKEGSISFSIGEDFGILLMRIAQENLLYSLNPAKAVSTITECLHGISDDLALRILKGDMIIETVGECDVNVRNRTPEDYKYPSLDLIGWFKREFDAIGDLGRNIHNLLENCLRKIVNTDGMVELEVSYESLLSYLYNKDAENLLSEIRGKSEFEYIAWLLHSTIRYLKRSYSVWNVMEFLSKRYPDEINGRNGCEFAKHDIVNLVSDKFNKLTNLNTDLLREHYAELDAPLLNHIKSEVVIQKELETTIKPLKIEDKRDSGWISPDGEWYGLNGEVSNLLHITIAEMISKKILKEESVYLKDNPYSWLENNGWVKVTGNWVLFNGYSQYGDNERHKLTEKQKSFIKDYCSIHYKGVVKIGFRNEIIPAVRITMLEDPMIAKLFSL